MSVNSTIVWVPRYSKKVSVALSQIGGHRPNILCGSHGNWLIERTQTVDFTRRGLVGEHVTRDVQVGYTFGAFRVGVGYVGVLGKNTKDNGVTATLSWGF